jgi:hypothetical protein
MAINYLRAAERGNRATPQSQREVGFWGGAHVPQMGLGDATDPPSLRSSIVSMANDNEHVALLKQGVAACNAWRRFVGGCGSVAAHPIVEEVIESNLHQLNIRVACGESVAAEEPSGWNNERPAVQP